MDELNKREQELAQEVKDWQLMFYQTRDELMATRKEVERLQEETGKLREFLSWVERDEHEARKEVERLRALLGVRDAKHPVELHNFSAESIAVGRAMLAAYQSRKAAREIVVADPWLDEDGEIAAGVAPDEYELFDTMDDLLGSLGGAENGED